MTDTIEYWLKEAKNAIRKAEEISELTGEEFYFATAYGMGGTYVPKKNRLSKKDALELLASGRTISEIEKAAIRKAIEEETIFDEGYSNQYTGWNSSSSNC